MKTKLYDRLALVLILFVIAASAVQAGEGFSKAIPVRGGSHVDDHAGMISADAELLLEQRLANVQATCDVEILVVTLEQLPMVRSNRLHRKHAAAIEPFATAMFDAYELGSMPRNQGVLLLCVRNDRKIRVELGAGYSSRYDKIAKSIIDDTITPHFRNQNYDAGFIDGVDQIAIRIAGEPVLSADSAAPLSRTWIASGSVLSLTFLWLTFSLLTQQKRGWGWVVIGIVYIGWLKFRNAVKRSASGSGGGHEDGSWWTDGGGGGDFGGGGGFSDGGGASGGW